MELSIKHPKIGIRLYFYQSINGPHNNGDGLFGIWETSNGSMKYSLESCYADCIHEEKDIISKDENVLPLLINSMLSRTRIYRVGNKN